MSTASEDKTRARSQGEHHLIARILQSGLVVASVLLFIGTALHAARGDTSAPAVKLFDVFRAPDLGIVLASLGVVVLGLTPMVRVVALVVLWIRDRDWRFVAVAFAVIVTLTAALVTGRG